MDESDAPLVPPATSRPILETGLRLMDEHMALIPPGKKRVAVFYLQPDGRIGFGTALRIGDAWEFSAEVAWHLKERPDAFVGLRWSD